ncbi:MAG: cobalt-precorrin-5B (C(1))-methyltransferase [Thermodesulfobacteriota bacterium]
MSDKLKEGFTTGSAAAAAAKAALLYLGGENVPEKVDIPLPSDGRIQIPVYGIEDCDSGAIATVVKDAGDDPDVTHNAHIKVTVELDNANNRENMEIHGGEGVGVVTKPGLPIEIGKAAINPEPEKQIRNTINETLDLLGLNVAVRATISVVNGEKIAQKTMNPRLGIEGGISILGTRGTVRPYSRSSYRATITSGLDVARAAGIREVALSTGGRSENMLKQHVHWLPESSFVLVADFFEFSLDKCREKGFNRVYYGCFFGKLLKMAQGFSYTHAKISRIDFALVASWCKTSGIEPELAEAVRNSNTGRQVMNYILESVNKKRIIEEITARAIASARGFSGENLGISYFVFDYQGNLLTQLSA